MSAFLETIHQIARQKLRGEVSPVLLQHQLQRAVGERVSHLPGVDPELAQAWLAMIGEPFRPHQAQAMTALRRNEPVAISASGGELDDTALLLTYAALHGDALTSALLVATTDAAAAQIAERVAAISAQLPPLQRLSAHVTEPGKRPDPTARIIVTTPDALHHRLLRHHERAWARLWNGLRIVVLLEAHSYHGVAGAQLGELLFRVRRTALRHNGAVPAWVATIAELDDAKTALSALTNQDWRVVGGDDAARDAATFIVWRGAADRLRESVELAQHLQRSGIPCHIACGPLDTLPLTAALGDLAGISFGPLLQPAPALVIAGYPGSHARFRQMLRAGYDGVALVLGDAPHEKMLALRADAVLTDSPTQWPPAPFNAYVMKQHVLCAASEQPLTEAEVQVWRASDVVGRLVDEGELVDLPDPEVAWKPTVAVGDPYEDFSLLAASGGPVVARSDRGYVLDQLDPTGFERWMFPNAALPPLTGGVRVVHRDEEHLMLTVRLENTGRRTLPLRRATVAVREERDSRSFAVTQRIGYGRVLVDEEIYAYRETGGNEVALKPPLEVRVAGPACWFDLPSGMNVTGQLIGWCLCAAVPLRALAALTDLVPCYDQEAHRLYFVDAQPGGSGVALWLYHNAEELLPLAYDVAHACRNDALLEPLARTEMDWLLPLLGSRPLERRPQPEPPQIVLTPAPEPVRLDERRAQASPPARQPSPPRSVEPSPPARQPSPPRSVEPSPPARPPSPPRSVEPSPPARQPSPPRSAEPSPPRKGDPTWSPGPPSPPARPPNPPRSAEPAPGGDEGGPADARALIERLRRQRQQREAQQPRQPAPPRPVNTGPAVTARFAAGDRIFCLPYGDGVVLESWFDNERELLAVEFPGYGELTVDPAVSLVRKIEAGPAQTEDDLL